MIEQAAIIADFVSGRERSDLDSNRMLLYAFLRAVEVFGEAAARYTRHRVTPLPHIRDRPTLAPGHHEHVAVGKLTDHAAPLRPVAVSR